jgi:hypothetical protein
VNSRPSYTSVPSSSTFLADGVAHQKKSLTPAVRVVHHESPENSAVLLVIVQALDIHVGDPTLQLEEVVRIHNLLDVFTTCQPGANVVTHIRLLVERRPHLPVRIRLSLMP